MKPLNLDLVNNYAPYRIREISPQKFSFVSSKGIAYVIGFMEDSMVEDYESYQFFITNESGLPSPNENDLWLTVFVAIEEFFRMNQSVMVYWCDTSDGHEALRSRLFTRKFNLFEGHDKYVFKSIETNTEGIPYYAALIFRKDHPQASKISSKVDYVVEELSRKPE